MDKKFNEVFLSFFSFNYEFSLGNRLIDIFPNCFSFYPSNRSNNQNIKSNSRHLDNITIQTLLDSHLVVVISDGSIKNQVTTFISHIYSHNKPVIKTIHHCYDLKLKGLSNKTTLVLSNTRELNRVPSTE